ncbi:MAG: hypothetical protein JNM93_06790 [Bacteriovoracaceae bacterium]|nr:hypothetical protein [Bacteriovoracaceae bacterium]
MVTRTLFILFVIFIINSCLKVEIQKISSFPTNTNALFHQFGRPLFKEPSKIHPENSLLHFNNGISFEVNGDAVMAKYISPKGLEIELDYWKEMFRPYTTNLREISGEIRRDGIPFQQVIKCDELGIQIIYSPSLNKVVKIIYFHKTNN